MLLYLEALTLLDMTTTLFQDYYLHVLDAILTPSIGGFHVLRLLRPVFPTLHRFNHRTELDFYESSMGYWRRVWLANRERLPIWKPGAVHPFWDLLVLQLLGPDSSNLPCLYSTFHLEYPLVLPRFCVFSLYRHAQLHFVYHPDLQLPLRTRLVKYTAWFCILCNKSHVYEYAYLVIVAFHWAREHIVTKYMTTLISKQLYSLHMKARHAILISWD